MQTPLRHASHPISLGLGAYGTNGGHTGIVGGNGIVLGIASTHEHFCTLGALDALHLGQIQPSVIVQPCLPP
jgi:hypothetical protein